MPPAICADTASGRRSTALWRAPAWAGSAVRTGNLGRKTFELDSRLFRTLKIFASFAFFLLLSLVGTSAEWS